GKRYPNPNPISQAPETVTCGILGTTGSPTTPAPSTCTTVVPEDPEDVDPDDEAELEDEEAVTTAAATLALMEANDPLDLAPGTFVDVVEAADDAEGGRGDGVVGRGDNEAEADVEAEADGGDETGGPTFFPGKDPGGETIDEDALDPDLDPGVDLDSRSNPAEEGDGEGDAVVNPGTTIPSGNLNFLMVLLLHYLHPDDDDDGDDDEMQMTRIRVIEVECEGRFGRLYVQGVECMVTWCGWRASNLPDELRPHYRKVEERLAQ
ncbi:hypothetical protein HDU67_005277, partial [Dinochytrium kinnereticum]